MSLMRLRLVLTAAIAAAICLAVSARPDAAANVNPFERLVARALNPSDAGATAPIDIVIERWSTDQECANLHDALMHAGSDKLLATLQHTWRRAGVMQLPGFQGLGSRARTRRSRIVQFARDIRTPSGRQVIVALDHPVTLDQPIVTLRERSRDARTARPEFTLIDIRFGPDGKGIGKIATASTVTYNKETRTLELANYATQPVRLTEVKSEK